MVQNIHAANRSRNAICGKTRPIWCALQTAPMLPAMRQATNPDDIRVMADDIARLMADRFGGARRGEFPSLYVMIRRRGAALPRSLRGHAQALAAADAMTAAPKIARQMDLTAPNRAYAALLNYLEPLGSLSRWQGRALTFAASVTFGLLVLAALILWLMVRRGYL